jgi:hypothetical protein
MALNTYSLNFAVVVDMTYLLERAMDPVVGREIPIMRMGARLTMTLRVIKAR